MSDDNDDIEIPDRPVAESKEPDRKPGQATTFDEGLDMIRDGKFEVSFENLGKVDQFQFMELCEMLQTNTVLKTLKLVGLELNDDQAESIAEFVKVNETLRSMSLSKNRIGNKGMKSIAAALAHNKCLEDLSFRENVIGDAGAEAFAEALRRNRVLTVVTLSNNKISDSGAKSIFGAIEENTTVTMLDLCDNPLTNDCVETLASLIARNKTLLSLFLLHTKLTKASVRPIVEALEKNNTLTFIQLPTEIDDIDGLERILKLCAENNENAAFKVESIVKMKKNTYPGGAGPKKKKLQLRLSARRTTFKMKDENIYGKLERI